jgi:hypothetical protein
MSTLTGKSTPVYEISAFEYEVAMGRLLGKTTVNKFGHVDDLDIATGEGLIAYQGGTFDPNTAVMSSAQTFTIAYNQTTDGLGQTGATQILISYLDENFELQDAVHVLSNTGSDVTSFTGLGINRAVVLANGGAGWNVNNITITATTDATTQAMIPALKSVTQQCIYHVPIGHTFLMNYIYIGALKLSGGGGDPRVSVTIYSWSRFTSTRYDVFDKEIDTTIDNHLQLKLTQPFTFSGREVIYAVATTDKDNTKINLRFSGVQEINQ